jgi:hypothetical protein
MPSDRAPPASSPWFGLWLIAVALFFLGFATQIERLEISNENDPGPRAFPVVLSLTLLVGGAVQTVIGLRGGRSKRTAGMTDQESPAGGWDPLLLASGLLIFLFIVPMVGFYGPTFVFAALMTRRLGARWWAAGTTAVVLILVIRTLFVGVFRVQLPEGVLGALV